MNAGSEGSARKGRSGRNVRKQTRLCHVEGNWRSHLEKSFFILRDSMSSSSHIPVFLRIHFESQARITFSFYFQIPLIEFNFHEMMAENCPVSFFGLWLLCLTFWWDPIRKAFKTATGNEEAASESSCTSPGFLRGQVLSLRTWSSWLSFLMENCLWKLLWKHSTKLRAQILLLCY